MDFELTDVLGAIGQAASLVFAAWIFMGFLRQRCTAACARCRSLIEDCRNGEPSANPRGGIKDRVMLQERCCELMAVAANPGPAAAILPIAALTADAANAVLSRLSPLKHLGAAAPRRASRRWSWRIRSFGGRSAASCWTRPISPAARAKPWATSRTRIGAFP